MRIGILGGGLTGLTIASTLCPELEVEVLEKKEECGGLCRSIQENGFTFDWGGAHIIYSRKKKPIDFIISKLGNNFVKGKRNNKIYFKGHFVKYPFENGLSDLPKKDNFECLYYYLYNNYPKPSNFKEWIYYTFGKGIAEKYLVPYNEKIWNYPAEKMSYHWVEGRVPKPPIEDVIKSAIGISTEGYTHQLYFYYPKYGGIQSLIKALERVINGNIETRFEVKEIKRNNNKWIVSDGKKVKKFDKLVSTIPIFDLISAFRDIPANIKNSVNNLKYNSLFSVMLGLNTNDLPNYTAIYFSDKKLRFHRIAFPKNFSPYNAPEGKSSVVVEITYNPEDMIGKKEEENIINEVIKCLHKLKIINKNEICYKNLKKVKYAYVIYDLEYLSNIKIIKDYFHAKGIILCGRFSEFEYLNMDACIERGLKSAQKINYILKEKQF